jgi:hypothetical protein
MRLLSLLFTAILVAAPALGEQTGASPPQDGAAPPPKDAVPLNLPVSVDRIKEALQQKPLFSLSTIDERPTFRVQIRERMKLDELIASLDFKAGPVPAGGVYMAEQQRIMFPSVDNPLVQPLAAFNQGELLTILVENLVGKYLGGRAINAVSNAERAHAEAAAREEVRAAIHDYCAARPNGGGGITICSSADR